MGGDKSPVLTMGLNWDKTKFNPVIVATEDSHRAKTTMSSEKPVVNGPAFCMENIYSNHINKGTSVIHLQKKNYYDLWFYPSDTVMDFTAENCFELKKTTVKEENQGGLMAGFITYKQAHEKVNKEKSG